MYAILSHGGRQHRVSAGDRLVVDRLDVEVGSVIALHPVLLTGGEGKTGLGSDVDGMRVAVTVVKHLRGEKLRVFKYKAKKRSRKVAGYRSELTELRVESILAKGAALPKAAATEAALKAAARDAAPKAAARDAVPKAAAAPRKPARSAAAEKPDATAKRAPRTTAARVADADDTVAAAEGAANAKAAPKPRAPRATRAAPKPGTGGAPAKKRDTGDGA
jgi:large subunit ribosomal protein L21